MCVGWDCFDHTFYFMANSEKTYFYEVNFESEQIRKKK